MQKTLENHQKSHLKSMPKPLENHQTNRFKKKSIFRCPAGNPPESPDPPMAPVRVSSPLWSLLERTKRQQKEDNPKERNSERSMQRDQPRPFNTPRAPSGPERIYWALGPTGLRGQSLRVPSGCSRPASAFRPGAPGRPIS